MPAPPLSNTLEGGSDGTTITTGNSGGASGDAFSAVTIAGSTTETFSADHAAHGGLSMKIAETVAGSTRVNWTGLGALTGSVYHRIYVWYDAFPTASGLIFGGVRTSTGAALSAQIRISGTGKIRVENAAAAFILALDGVVAIPLSQWARIEFRCKSSTTVGEFEWKWWSSADSSGTPDETLSATGQVLGADQDELRYGIVTNAPASPFTAYFDDMAVSTTDWIGPAGAPPPPATTVPQFAAQGARW
jgi:hypothetical protein